MIAAIYARKSTEQTRVDDDAKSVTRQVENARAFAAERGWTVAAEHVYVDDAVSGAEIRKLRAKRRFLDVIRAGRPPFDVLIMQDSDRLSRRDGAEALVELKSIAKAGVQVWFYAKRERFTYGDFQSNVTGFFKAEFNAEFRRAIAAKTTEALQKKARAGHVTGGKVFGYDNVRVNGHVERRVNETEATVVREIFDRYAAGVGFRVIAHELNARRVPSPRPQRGRPAGWEPSTVREVLGRPLYRGVIVWNRSKKRDDDGEQRQRPRPESEWLRVEAPQLRIVDEAVGVAVDERRADRRDRYLRAPGGRIIARSSTTTGKYLLSGLLMCPCGGSFEAQKNPHGRRPGHVYVCSTRRRKGPAVCANDLALPIAETDDAILTVIEGEVLDPKVIDRVLDSAFADPADDRAVLEAERARLVAELTNLTAAIAAGGEIGALVDALRERDRRLKSIDVRLTAREAPDREALRRALEQRIDEWRTVLRAHPTQARMVLQHVVGPIHLFPSGEDVVFTPARALDVIPWAASSNPAGLLTGLVQRMASLMPASWNRIVPWLRAVNELGRVA